MPLNYSKWDKLEVSDDSDIEGHPNVDHRSLVAWKQRDIREKRAARNAKIEQLKAEIACNEILLPRLRTITEEVHGAPDGPAHFSSIVERLKTNPSPDAPPSKAPKKITYDEMILSLLLKVFEEAKEKGLTTAGGENEERLRECLVASLKGHVSKLGDETERLKKELEKEEAEKLKKITSEDIHEGFESHYAPPIPEPEPVKGAHKHGKKKVETKTDIEVINPKGVEHAQVAALASQSTPAGPSSSSSAAAATKEDDEDEEVPEMTPSLEAFSHLPLRGYEESFHFIQEHRDVYVPGASDALLVAGFRAEREGRHAYAKQCVHQALLIQYCEQLGTDGVRLFFKRMTAGDPRVERVFQTDVENTYKHVKSRAEATNAEMDRSGEGQIQLVAEGDGTQISFVVPDGPPPEHLELEGPGTENLDIEQVRRVLQMRWDVFNGFRDDLKEALKSQKLEEVNKVLASMTVEEAEKVVQLLDQSGILSFAEGGIRDETGRGKTADDEEGIEDVPESGDEADVEEVRTVVT
ncbi:CDC37_3 [Sanghuangporus weigelae]